MNQIIVVAHARKVRITLAKQVLGMTEDAIRTNIKRKRWAEGQQYETAPDGTVWINIEGVMKWVEKRSTVG
jgi:hypothetical protein